MRTASDTVPAYVNPADGNGELHKAQRTWRILASFQDHRQFFVHKEGISKPLVSASLT
jgi:hypothetical protein